MRTILYRTYGEPAQVLEVAEVPDLPAPGAGEVLVRVQARPVHPGDLLGVQGRYRAPGDTSPVAEGGARPGFEGMGVIEALGANVADASGLAVGARVAFFPGRWGWGERVLVSAEYVTAIPEDVPDEIAAQLHVTPLTAMLLLRAAEAAGIRPGGEDVMVITAAGSVVAKLATALARQRGFRVVNAVRSRARVAELTAVHPDVPVISTDAPDWRDHLRLATGGRAIRVVLDPVGGDLASAMVERLASGGTLISYGDLSGEPIRVDSLAFSVRDVRIHGVSVGRWASLPSDVRAHDLKTVLALSRTAPKLFAVAGSYDLSQVRDAVTHSRTPGKAGVVLLTSR
ncbi:zinc-binding dehydrogenase [Microvirga sp. BT688]|uniref:zinc-binding dehydrogenase n=1 Tax=Microvirga sp. TaxID=1873136 RepID=UPI00168806CB|nr:zinc-binding dehydrogenase [Microvirga sp.]MBD2749112.1 zinc-binding dehydrogenase [Microvirga sp.]